MSTTHGQHQLLGIGKFVLLNLLCSRVHCEDYKSNRICSNGESLLL